MPLISAEEFWKPQISLITLIFNKLQIKQIAQKLLMRKRMNFHRLADARKKFTPNLLDKFTPHLLSTALAEHVFWKPQITLITLISNKLQILQIGQIYFS